MTRIAVFPGQGAQVVGMGRALHDAFPAARAVFAEVDDALGERLSALIFDGPAEQLTLTANTQPALMAMSLAAVRALEAATGRALGRAGAATSPATASASTRPWRPRGRSRIGDAARLLRLRGQAMQDCGAGGGRRDGGHPGRRRGDGRGGRRRGRGRGRRLRARQRQWRRPAGDLGQHGRGRARGGAGQGAWGAAQRPAAGVGPVPLRADGARGRAAGRRDRGGRARAAGGAADRQRHGRARAGSGHHPGAARAAGHRARALARDHGDDGAAGRGHGHRARCRQGADRPRQARRARGGPGQHPGSGGHRGAWRCGSRRWRLDHVRSVRPAGAGHRRLGRHRRRDRARVCMPRAATSSWPAGAARRWPSSPPRWASDARSRPATSRDAAAADALVGSGRSGRHPGQQCRHHARHAGAPARRTRTGRRCSTPTSVRPFASRARP